jgi:hypothetical protein
MRYDVPLFIEYIDFKIRMYVQMPIIKKLSAFYLTNVSLKYKYSQKCLRTLHCFDQFYQYPHILIDLCKAGSPKLSLYFRFSNKNFVRISLLHDISRTFKNSVPTSQEIYYLIHYKAKLVLILWII